MRLHLTRATPSGRDELLTHRAGKFSPSGKLVFEPAESSITTSHRTELAQLRQAERHCQDRLAVRQRIARLLVDAGRWRFAERYLFSLASEESKNLRVQYWVAVELSLIGAFEPSARLLERYVEQHPRHGEALRWLSAVHASQGNHSLARRLRIQAARVQPLVHPAGSNSKRPRLLKFCAVTNSPMVIRRSRVNRRYRRALLEGHFSTTALLPRESMPASTAYLLSVKENLQVTSIWDLFLNTISDPDIHRDALSAASAWCRAHPEVPVVNHPDRILATTRDQMAGRLAGLAGLVVPATRRIRFDGDAARFIDQARSAGIDFPFLLRAVGTHTGDSLCLLEGPVELRQVLGRLRVTTELFVTQYVDCRGADGFFHKHRAFLVDGDLYPVAGLTSDHWQIHSGDRYRLMSRLPPAQAREMRFLSAPEDFLNASALASLRSLADKVPLDFFGIDFCPLADGSALVFECNAVMRHNYDHAETFPYTKPFLQTVSRAFQSMIARRALP